jgi:hypothetical protein
MNEATLDRLLCIIEALSARVAALEFALQAEPDCEPPVTLQ